MYTKRSLNKFMLKNKLLKYLRYSNLYLLSILKWNKFFIRMTTTQTKSTVTYRLVYRQITHTNRRLQKGCKA